MTEKRGAQRKVWMWRQITSELVDRLNSDDKVKQHVAELESKVFDGKMTSGQAADSVVDVFLNKVKEDRIWWKLGFFNTNLILTVATQ